MLKYAALAAKWLEPPKARHNCATAQRNSTTGHHAALRALPQDALDTLVLGAADLASLAPFKQVDYVPFDPHIKRTEATVVAPDGTRFKARSSTRTRARAVAAGAAAGGACAALAKCPPLTPSAPVWRHS